MRYLTASILAACLFFMDAGVAEEIEYVTKTTTMDGASCREAIANALVEALRQVRGIDVESETISLIKSLGYTEDGKDGFEGKNQLSQDISSKTGGYIQSYDIDNFDKGTNDCQVTITATIPRSTIKKDSSAKSMTVLPFRVKDTEYQIGKTSVSAAGVSRQFTQKVITQLTQARKLIVLDRDYKTEYDSEKLLIKSHDVQKIEQLKLGQQSGADYLLVGEINDFHIQSYEKLENFSRYKITDAILNLDYRVIDVVQRKILWADSVKIPVTGNTAETDSISIRDHLLDSGSTFLVDSIMEMIYPVRVLKVAGNAIYLNQGGKRITKGRLFDVFSESEDLIDPDTGKVIRIDGEVVATLKIKKVMAKYSLAKLVSGDTDEIQVNSIVRRHVPE